MGRLLTHRLGTNIRTAPTNSLSDSSRSFCPKCKNHFFFSIYNYPGDLNAFYVLQELYYSVCLMTAFTAVQSSPFYFLFAFTTAGVVSCGGPKKYPRTSFTVQIIFSF